MAGDDTILIASIPALSFSSSNKSSIISILFVFKKLLFVLLRCLIAVLLLHLVKLQMFVLAVADLMHQLFD